MVGFSRLVATLDPKNARACGEMRATNAVQAEWPAVAGDSLWTRVLVLVSRHELINPSVVAEGFKPFKRERRRRVAGERFELMIEVGLVGVVTEKGSAGPGEKLGGIPRLEKCGNRAAENAGYERKPWVQDRLHPGNGGEDAARRQRVRPPHPEWGPIPLRCGLSVWRVRRVGFASAWRHGG